MANYAESTTGIGLAFPTGWDRETFWDNGTEVPSLSREKGTTGQAKNLAKGRDGTGRDSQNSGWDGMGQPKFGSRRGTKWDKAESDVLKQGQRDTATRFFCPGT